jgi:hypothetical protein
MAQHKVRFVALRTESKLVMLKFETTSGGAIVYIKALKVVGKTTRCRSIKN